MTVSGTEESVLLAQFLIQSNIDLAVKEMREQQQQQQGFGNPMYRPDGFGPPEGFGPPDGNPMQEEPGFDQNRRWGNQNFRQNFRGSNDRGGGFPDHGMDGFQNGRGGFQNDRGGFRGGPPRGVGPDRGGPMGRGVRGMRGLRRWQTDPKISVEI